MSEGTCFLSIFFTHRTVKPLALCPAGCTHCSGLSSSAGSTLLYSEGWWASGVGSIWTNQSCFARKDVVFMATLAGRACARSAGERKTSEKSKNRFKKTGHLLRGLSVSLCLLFCRLLVLLACSCLSVRPSIHLTMIVIVVPSFPSQAAERGRGSLCKQTSEGPITANHHTVQQVWGKKNKGKVQQSQHSHKVFYSVHKNTTKKRYILLHIHTCCSGFER